MSCLTLAWCLKPDADSVGMLSRLFPCRSQWTVSDVPVGPDAEQYIHTTSGGAPDAPPLVLCPGYGAGTGFFFRSAVTAAKLVKMPEALSP